MLAHIELLAESRIGYLVTISTHHHRNVAKVKWKNQQRNSRGIIVRAHPRIKAS